MVREVGTAAGDTAAAAPLKETSSTNNNASHDDIRVPSDGSVSLVTVIDAISVSMHAGLQSVLDKYGGPHATIESDNNTSDTLQLVQQLTWSRQAERALRLKVAALEAAHTRLDDALAYHDLLRAKLKDELVRERLVSLNLKKELEACIGKLEHAKTSPEYLGGGHVWTSSKANTSTRTSAPPHGDPASLSTDPAMQPTPLYSFYPTADAHTADDDDLVHPSSASSPLSSSRHSLMDQYLPSTLLLDSPCVVPQQPTPQDDNPTEKTAFSLDDGMETTPPARTLDPTRSTWAVLCDLFPDIPVADVHAAFLASQSDVGATMDSLIHSHKSFQPAPGSRQSLPVTTHVAAPLNWKTELCVYFLQGKCNKNRRTCSFAHGEADLFPRQAHHLAPTALKTRLCPLYVDGGSCPRPRRDCPLAHGEADLVVVNGGSAAPPKSTLAGMTAAGGPPLPPPLPAQLAHHVHPMMAPPPSTGGPAPRLQNYKTEMCFYYLKGCCNYSTDECRFAHGDSDLRTIESNAMHQGPVVDWGGLDRKAMMGHEYGMNLHHQLLYQQQAPSSRTSGVMPPPLPPAGMYPRYMAKDELTKRRATFPARRESMNAMPSTWAIGGRQLSPTDN
ncbi:hypothetical protein DYB32_007825 [Aphanomyces invadans]|uniref:C3H1-type domain-containing protein n=1 Tax=Aphanomyces invadans TaxID=157072 RepID=A0A3R6VHP8_9STRA|nr:hypothetical protein DYB32_007825 [Aphanomyces invadans]